MNRICIDETTEYHNWIRVNPPWLGALHWFDSMCIVVRSRGDSRSQLLVDREFRQGGHEKSQIKYWKSIKCGSESSLRWHINVKLICLVHPCSRLSDSIDATHILWWFFYFFCMTLDRILVLHRCILSLSLAILQIYNGVFVEQRPHFYGLKGWDGFYASWILCCFEIIKNKTELFNISMNKSISK